MNDPTLMRLTDLIVTMSNEELEQRVEIADLKEQLESLQIRTEFLQTAIDKEFLPEIAGLKTNLELARGQSYWDKSDLKKNLKLRDKRIDFLEALIEDLKNNSTLASLDCEYCEDLDPNCVYCDDIRANDDDIRSTEQAICEDYQDLALGDVRVLDPGPVFSVNDGSFVQAEIDQQAESEG